MNSINIAGRLTATPELKTTQSGTSVCAATVAVPRDFVKQGEERQTDFIDIVAWRNTAEFISKYFTKGQMILVTGSLQTRQYEDKNGNKRKAYEIVVDKAGFAGDSARPQAVEDKPQGFEAIDDDCDLPF